ncbi:MAG: TIGR03862 family flavoprotein [Bacteroidetes bacterium]|nr:TIGR03862 family flavoprotein [Bacteroidota bacterium]
MKKSIAIIGSGPAALMLAATLDENAFEVTVYERNSVPARKFLVAGDGGFNLTHSENIEQFISRYTPSYFLEKSIRSFSNSDLRNWLNDIGIETFIGTSKRVFPVKPIKPIDVLNAFLTKLKNDNKELIVKADLTVFALGGASWSKTGSTGDWTDYFTEKNIAIIPFQPSNCAYQIKWNPNFITSSEGKPLKNIAVFCDGIEKKGEVVVTQFGIEGGAVYALSPKIRQQLNKNNFAEILIDLKPMLTTEVVRAKLNSTGNKTISNLLSDELKLNNVAIALLKSVLPKEEFTNTALLAGKIKQLPLQITGMAPIDEAISTVGGIALNELDENFQVKKLPGHFAIGEMLDWDAPTGGYLLQGCFSMGHYLAQQLNDGKNSTEEKSRKQN